ncbi:amino acid adenylation domain-containing protein, partial [Photorhabdus viridis]|uniref:amino acid adenylation domain-containing protein n=1 Tax=Photorhabdus viridis TaxID=3163327 RepID=UPI003307B6F6
MKDNIATVGNVLKAEALSQMSCENITHNTNDTSTPSQTCVVVGGTTLAVFCAGQIQAAGHTIQAVLPTDTVLQTWAVQQGIACVNSVDALQEQITSHPVDWLFSVVNPMILPVSLIKQIRGGAFNYHDSPLPRYAGRHATSWALLAQETHYAISWHCIEGGVDTGDIAVQWPVSIEEHDNAFSLNLKCYQAAQKGFIELLKNLGHGALETYPQDLSQRSFYALSHRPDFGGYLCWEQSGEALSALVRALDFGENYSNPLGCPKLLLRQGPVQISWLQRLKQRSEGVPGTLIRVEEDAWQVTTGSEDVRIGGFATLEGHLLSARELADISELRSGKPLPLLSSQQAQNVKNTLQALAPSEPFWCERLAALQPLQLPFEMIGKQAEPRWVMGPWQPPLPKNDAEDPLQSLLQIFVIYLARLTQQAQFQIGWCVDEVKDKSADLASMVPMSIEVAFDKPWRVVADWVDDELARLAQHRTFSRDLPSRSPLLRAIPALRTSRPWQIAVTVIQDDRPCAQEALGELLTLQMNVQGGFRWIYDENRLSPEVILRMSEHLKVLALSKRGGDEIPVWQLNLLPEAERTLLLETWNATETAYPEQLCIHQLFEQQVEKTPEATALIAGDKTFSYTELNTRANRLARQLIEQGVDPGDHVALLLERSMGLVVAQLAILKAGAVYVPIDPNVPDERKNWLMSDCSVRLLLTDTREDIPANLAVPLLRLSDETDTNREEDCLNPDLPRSSAELAYIMYTSGSTGTPKGVLVPHRAVVRLVINNGYAEIGADDRVAFAANPAFDASTFEVWAPLLNGGALVVVEHVTLLTPQTFVQTLQVQRMTVLWLSVGLFNQLAAELSPVLPQIKLLIVGGDALDPHVIGQVLSTNPPQQLLNGYGPSEGTTFTTTYRINALAQGATRIPIGRPVANTRVYLLDAYGQPVPLGGDGEIYVGGDGVAQGYFNRPELTAERFLVDPFSDNPDARMYRTGDLARYLPDGNIEFLGRNDQQVKIRGFRIELGEIEARLAEHPAVHEVVVLTRGEGEDKRLAAYVVASADDGLVNSLRAHLSAILPDYMVPSAFVRLDAFPLTPNGKLDRRALPAPDNEAFAYQVYEAPQGETEMALAAIWRELLGIEQVSRHDSFFALGGHSLLAIRVVERLRHFGLTLTARDLFQFPVLFELARSLGQHQAVIVPPNVITPADTTLTPAMLPLIDLTQAEIDRIVEQVPGGVANIQDIYALSPLQDGILFHHLLANEGDPYLLTGLIAFADRSLLDRYLAAVQRAVDRHDILRTAFIWQGLSVPAQVVWRQATLSVMELTLDPADGAISDQLTRRFDPRHHRLDLGEAPLLRFVVAQETDGRWIVLQLLHHLIGDHETMEVMHREVQAYLTDQADSLPAPVPFRNLVAQARLGVSQEAHTRFFTEMLAAVDEPTLPFGLAEVRRDGSQVTEFHRMLAPELNDRLRSQARHLGVSLAALCHLAWAQVLSRTSGQKKVVFGTVLFGRMQAGDSADNGMGLFINTLPLQLNIDETPVRDSVQAAHTRLAGLLAHEHASLALAQRCSGVQGDLPLFNSLLNYRHNTLPVMSDKLISGIEFLGAQERTNYPLMLSVEDFGEAL